MVRVVVECEQEGVLVSGSAVALHGLVRHGAMVAVAAVRETEEKMHQVSIEPPAVWMVGSSHHRI